MSNTLWIIVAYSNQSGHHFSKDPLKNLQVKVVEAAITYPVPKKTMVKTYKPSSIPTPMGHH